MQIYVLAKQCNATLCLTRLFKTGQTFAYLNSFNFTEEFTWMMHFLFMVKWTNSLFLLISPGISLSLISFDVITLFLFSICSRSVLCVSAVPKALSWIGSAISDFRLLFSHKVGFPHGYKANLLPLNWKGNFHNCIIFH